jgi:hypothetical protein
MFFNSKCNRVCREDIIEVNGRHVLKSEEVVE